MNNITKTGSALGLAGLLTLTGCVPMYGPGSERDYPPVAYSRDLYPGYGSVYAIDLIRYENESSIGVGTIAGAVIGGLIGHQVGDGKGNTAATVIGAAGGALIGHEIERRNQPQIDQFRLTIRMENGGYQTLLQNQDFVDLRVGDRIHIDNGGAVRRY
ncbi:MAG: glycine zipper 2TM domain-containing protein [Azonexus sp.]|nr:glycine zipper 2TM domain-containing protein [Azonexus sp.]